MCAPANDARGPFHVPHIPSRFFLSALLPRTGTLISPSESATHGLTFGLSPICRRVRLRGSTVLAQRQDRTINLKSIACAPLFFSSTRRNPIYPTRLVQIKCAWRELPAHVNHSIFRIPDISIPFLCDSPEKKKIDIVTPSQQ